MKSILVLKQKLDDLRVCVVCKSSETYIKSNGKEKWGFINKDKSKLICKKCNDKKYSKDNLEKKKIWSKDYYKKNTEKIKKMTKAWAESNLEKTRKYKREWGRNHPTSVKKIQGRRITFKGKRFMLKENPRTGICSNCNKSVNNGEIKKTHMHHEKYDENNPLAHTIELCAGCHSKTHARLRKEVLI